MARHTNVGAPDYEALAEFRYQIRRYLRFSENAARSEGLEPQQHQLLLALKALSRRATPTVGELAGWLLLRHHSAVGLVDRLAKRGMVRRTRSGADRRRVQVEITPRGERVLHRLSVVHLAELRSARQELVRALRRLLPRTRSRRRATR